MNFLAHLLLARSTPESLTGNFAGDFVKGTVKSLEQRIPAPILEGIRQHRAIDLFTDAHPTFSRARDLLSPERRRFAGIVVDIFYDHFLTQDWPEETRSCSEFIDYSYKTLFSTKDLVNELPLPVGRMIDQDWLGSYSSQEGIALTMRRIVSRSPKVSPIIGAEQDLTRNFEAFEELFASFFPDLLAFNRVWLEEA